MDTIGVVAPVYGGIDLYFLEMFNGVMNEALLHDQSVNVLPIAGWGADAPSRLLRYCDGRVDGLILVVPVHLERGFLASVRAHTPVVTIQATDPDPAVSDLEIDDEGGIHAMVTHLVSIGHRRIAHLAGDLSWPTGRSRLNGYRRALSDHAITYDPDLVLLPGNFTQRSGEERTARFLDAVAGWPEAARPTAICCANDATAFGCLTQLASRGIRVPQDISVTGFDDVLTSQSGETPLTTVRQPFMSIGARAVQIVLEEIQAQRRSEPAPEPRTERFGVTLKLRASVAPRTMSLP
jgi:LacI family transcriptional regulator